ncbi:PASTA domain-containing protein [Streptomyces sp. NPDC026665]|uniref:PASTA domain-containing protein n=1 Tax=Streptomyces sp. NPDC026665 TaxID=3154798 RepID=UPI0033D3CDB1
MFVIRAVAAGVSQADPFFAENGTLGRDTTAAPRARPVGGVQASNSPGLYGGTPAGDHAGDPGGRDDGAGGSGGRDGNGGTSGQDGTPGPDGSRGSAPDFGGSARPGTCVVTKLKEFLTAPKNSAKAREWARVLDIAPDALPAYIDRLTPVVLRHDTLVTNHAYKRGKAVPFESLLQAGIAVLVDRQGLPAVKCSCGNPLRPSRADLAKSSVGFQGGNSKWPGFRHNRIVVVEPPPGKAPISRLRLVDVDDPGRGISRPLGTEGERDTSFDPRAGTTVPPVTGLTFAEASARLAGAGLALSFDGPSLPPDDSPVTSSEPPAGSALRWGSQVTLSVSGPGDSGGPGTPTDTGGPTPDPDRSGPGTDGTWSGEPGTGTTTDGTTDDTTTDGTTMGATTEGATTDGTTTGGTGGATTDGSDAGGTTTGQATTDGSTTGSAGETGDGTAGAGSATTGGGATATATGDSGAAGATGSGAAAASSGSAGGVT